MSSSLIPGSVIAISDSAKSTLSIARTSALATTRYHASNREIRVCEIICDAIAESIAGSAMVLSCIYKGQRQDATDACWVINQLCCTTLGARATGNQFAAKALRCRRYNHRTAGFLPIQFKYRRFSSCDDPGHMELTGWGGQGTVFGSVGRELVKC